MWAACPTIMSWAEHADLLRKIRPFWPRIPFTPSRKTPQNARIRAFPENHYRRPNCQNTRANRSKTTPKIWVSFHFPPTGACVSADLPTETHGGRFIEGSKTGDFTRVFWPKSREIRVFSHVEEGFQPPTHQQTLLGACRLRTLVASPGCDASVLPAFGQLPVHVIPTLSHGRPVPLGGLVAQEGGCEQGDRHELTSHKFFRQSGFLSGKIRAYKLLPGIFLEISYFEPEKNRPEKFRVNFFCNSQLSRQKFSGPGNFAARKSTGFRIPWPRFRRTVYDGDVS